MAAVAGTLGNNLALEVIYSPPINIFLKKVPTPGNRVGTFFKMLSSDRWQFFCGDGWKRSQIYKLDILVTSGANVSAFPEMDDYSSFNTRAFTLALDLQTMHIRILPMVQRMTKLPLDWQISSMRTVSAIMAEMA